MALVASVVLAKLRGPGSEVCIGISLGLGCGLGFMALATSQIRRRHG